MNCPHCNVTLRTESRHGVEIESCPKCQGVWLDKGEIEKLVSRSSSSASPFETRTEERREYDPSQAERDDTPHIAPETKGGDFINKPMDA